MKKVSVVVALAMTLVLAFAVSAFAAQAFDTTTSPAVSVATPGGTTFDGTATDKYGAGANPANPATDWSANAGFSANQNVVGGAPSTAPDGQLPTNADGSTTQAVTHIHSNYAKNTNACAACHATHTAVGADLLQWSGETETCMACHDGTAGVATYDVSSGHIGATATATNGGVFPTGNQTSKSMHDVFGGIELTAAPGGNYSATTGTWTDEFSCVSCHTPHGNGGNFRILDPNVNGYADNHKVTKQQMQADIDNPGAYAVKVLYADTNGNNPFFAYLLTAPHGYSVSVYKGVDSATAVALTEGTDYTLSIVKDHTSIKPTAALNGENLYITGKVALKVKGNIENYLSATEKVTYVNGFNDFCGACHTDYNTSIYTTDGNGKTVHPADTATNYYDEYGDNIVKARHAVDAPTGVYSKAYRHTVGFDAGSDGHGGFPAGLVFETRTYLTKDASGKTPGQAGYIKTPATANMMSCMTCHVAHGTDDAWWQAYGQRTYDGATLASYGALPAPEAAPAEVYSADNPNTIGGSAGFNIRGSNLKRLPNMAMCEACHGKGSGGAGYNITDNAY